jgi:hypothetical protein
MDGINAIVLLGITELFKLHGIKYIVAGGYPRDMYLGITPKDIDIFVEDVGHVKHMLDELSVQYESFPHYGEVETNRIRGVIKIGAIDIIGMSEAAVTPLDQVLHHFDYNINQFVMLNDTPTFVGKSYGTLCRVGETEHEARINHITEKAKRANWNVKTT